MLPAAFDYRAPTSLDEALGVLKQHGDEAKVMAGGQSLIPLLKLRFSRPELVVDIARIPDLNTIKREDADGHFAIGALARHVDIENSKELAIAAPMLAEAAHWIADPLVRNRGTLVGSICHADPAGDWGRSSWLSVPTSWPPRSPGSASSTPRTSFKVRSRQLSTRTKS